MRRNVLLLATTLAIAASTGCGIEKTSTPQDYSGPSEFGLSVTMTASPDILPRDGRSQSVIVVTVRDSSGSPVASQGVRLGVSAGRLSDTDVTSGSNGVATTVYTAPGLNEDVSTATISAVPVGGDFGNSVPRYVSIGLVGSSLPVPSFTWTPQSPARFQLTAFDASATTVGGTRCGSACTYAWEFGGEATATGAFVSYRFQEEASYRVTVTVTTPSGTSASASNIVTVTAGARPTAVLRVSPASPCVNQSVFFNGSESTAANGASIAAYEWDFGNGKTDTTSSATTSTSYDASGTYTALLTVVDSNGLRASASAPVTVRVPSAGQSTCQ